MIMYDHENSDHYKFIVMWFLDIGDDAHNVICGKDDGDETGISSVSDNSGNIHVMLKITKIGWHIR